MTITTTEVSAIKPLTHDEAMRGQAEELNRTLTRRAFVPSARASTQALSRSTNIRFAARRVFTRSIVASASAIERAARCDAAARA
ncbi:MAG TPA: hypothetical protein VF843_12950, partial [Streptosporangiaceae bacterium]